MVWQHIVKICVKYLYSRSYSSLKYGILSNVHSNKKKLDAHGCIFMRTLFWHIVPENSNTMLNPTTETGAILNFPVFLVTRWK